MKKQQAVTMIQELSNAFGVSGFEEEVTQVFRKYTKTAADFETDGIKNVYASLKQNIRDRAVLQLDAHSDEVGFMIQAIREDGLLRFLPVGGWIAANATAQKVKIRNQQGRLVSGIITSKPPHFMSAQEKKMPISFDHLFIDIGASSKKEVEENYQIVIGSPVIPAVTCEYDEQTERFLGKAFDCRIGDACMADVLTELAQDDLAVDITATLSSQEEVGERGAIVASNKVKADLGIVFEGCPADEMEESYLIQSAMGKGPMVRNMDVSMITNPEFQAYAFEVARKNKIPIQASVRKGGGTNGSAINEVKGAPAIVVGIPVRYAHTSHCYVDMTDYQHAKKLVLAIIRSLDQKKLQQLIKPLEKSDY